MWKDIWDYLQEIQRKRKVGKNSNLEVKCVLSTTIKSKHHRRIDDQPFPQLQEQQNLVLKGPTGYQHF